MKCKKWLALSMAAAMFLSMATGVFAAAESPSEIVTVVSDEKPTFSAGESTRNMPYEIAGSAERMSDTENKVSDRVTFKSFLAQGSVTASGTSGKCGDNVSWNFDVSSGKLTLSGSGKMTDYDMDKNSEPGWRSYAEQVKTVVIGNGITTIGDEAFAFCSSLQSVSISDTVTSIGARAFLNCVSLQSASLPKKLTTIKKSAFNNCIVLTNVVLPETLGTIGEWAFENCYKVTSLHIPKNVKTIESSPFDGSSIAKITVDAANQNFAAVDNVLFNKTKTKLLYYPIGKTLQSYSIPTTVTEIGEAAFYYNSSLRTVTIPASVKKIGYFAFAYCDNISTISIPDSVTEIGYRAFFKCSNLSKCNVSKSLKTIELGLFEQCYKLTDVTIPNTVKSIDKWAFLNTGIKSIDIPQNVESIGQEAFYQCRSLQELKLRNGLKSIGEYCFYGTALPQIYIPSSVTKIDAVAFPYGFFSEIETKLYGEKGSYGEEYAKKYGYTFVVGNLPNVETNVIISQSGTFPSGQQWSYNADTQTMTLTGKGKIEGYDYHSDYYSLFRKVGDATKQLVIGEGITGFNSWWYFSRMEGISLPKTLCLIYEDDWGDEQCVITGREFSHLYEFKVSSDNPYHTCENGILFSKDKTTLVSYPPKKMGHSYSIPKTVKTIVEDAFYGCTNLRNVTIPEGVKKIGDQAFMNCNYLSSIVVPDSVTELGKGAFADCSVLENAVLGKNITKLNGTFAGCEKLESISLPDGLKNLDSAWLHNGEGTWEVDVFDGCDSLKRIFIPKNVT